MLHRLQGTGVTRGKSLWCVCVWVGVGGRGSGIGQRVSYTQGRVGDVVVSDKTC